MRFKPKRRTPQFADLKIILAQSKKTDNALYQTVQEIIERLTQFQFNVDEDIAASTGGGGGVDPTLQFATKFATYHTKQDEVATLPNSLQILAGTGIAFDDTVPNKRTIVATGAATPVAHAPTHQPGGSDPMQVDAVPATGSLRTLGSGPNQAAPGDDPRFTNARPPTAHAPTHSEGAADPVDIKNLAGYPGGTTAFLRADKTFAVPPGGGGGGMEYLGDYVPATYNDGDIVVAADGIAYVCTVDGTTTPPEPWPGVGVAVNATVDASYWVVSPHAALTNERVMSSLANGYVKSTGGEPSTVALIPVSEGGTGATDATAARTNLGVGNVGTLNLNGNASTWLNGVGTFTAPPSIPTGMIGMFAVACPAGWTRLAAWDGRFPRAMPAYGGFGGAGTHTHTVSGAVDSHAHGAGSLTMPNHNHGGSATGVTDEQGNHAHTVPAHATGASDTNQDADAGSSFGAARFNHAHQIGAVATDAQGIHAHNVTVSIPNDNNQWPIPGATAAAAPGFSGSAAAADHTPYYFDVVMCLKD